MSAKEYVMKYIGYISDWKDSTYIPIQKMIDDLESVKNKGATHLFISYDDEGIEYRVEKYELETDSEYEERIKNETVKLEKQREKEFKLYQELKLKFENQ